MDPKLFIATKAFIVHEGKVLILRESSNYTEGTNAKKFDVVGGRLKPGEKFDESLVRETFEETGLSIDIKKPFYVGEWRPVVKEEQWQIVGIFFECTSKSDKITLSKDHDKYEWIKPEEYLKHNLIPNLIPAFETFLKK